MGEQNEYLCDLDGSIWNKMGTQNSKKYHDHPPSPPQRKKILGLLGACCFTPLTAKNSYLIHVNYHFSLMSHV